MYLSITNNSITFSSKGITITTIVSQEIADQLTEWVKKGEITHDKVMKLISVDEKVDYESNEYFVRKGAAMYLKGVESVSIPKTLLKKMYPNPPVSLVNFWKLAALNPNPVARDGLFWFLDKHDFEITLEGYFVAYRNVERTQQDGVYTDHYTKTFRIRVGEEVRIDRSLCDDNPNITCSHGLHVASKNWLSENYFGNVGLVCLVNPINVVAVPEKDDYGKMRCCAYFPIGLTNYNKEGRLVDSCIDDYEYTLDKLTENQLDMMLAQARPVDGEIKRTCVGNQDYKNLILTAREVIRDRLFDASLGEQDSDYADYDYDHAEWDDDIY